MFHNLILITYIITFLMSIMGLLAAFSHVKTIVTSGLLYGHKPTASLPLEGRHDKQKEDRGCGLPWAYINCLYHQALRLRALPDRLYDVIILRLFLENRLKFIHLFLKSQVWSHAVDTHVLSLVVPLLILLIGIHNGICDKVEDLL